MAQYIVDSDDQTTENLLALYRDERIGVQTTAGQMYQAIVRTEAAYVAFDALLAQGGALADLADYHTAKQAPLNALILTLRAKMAEVTALMEQMTAAVPGLFPGGPQ
jgi:hypothetical protein